MNWAIGLLLLLALPPLFAMAVFGVYKLATAKHLGFWLLTVLWSAAILGWAVLGGGLVMANRHGRFADLPVQFWQEWFAASVVVGGGLLTLLTLFRNLILAFLRRHQPAERPPVVGVPASRRPEPTSSAAGGLGGFVGWTAAVVGFFTAWVWCVSRYADARPDAPAITAAVAIGLLVLAVVADFVRGLLHSRGPGEPRRWFFLSPAGGSFTGRLLIGGVLLAVCVAGTLLLSTAVGYDLNLINHPPPDPARPYLPLISLGVVFVAMGVGAFAAARRAGRRPKRKLSPQELDELIRSVPPLSPERRKALFWIYTLVMALGVIFLIGAVFEQMGPGCFAFMLAFFILSSGASSLFVIRDWAFKKGPEATAPPLAVAPLVLTPDPTPAKGNCPTCGSSIPAGSPQGLCPRCLIRGVMPSANATRARSVRPIDPPPAAEVNEFFPHLEVLELIGAGGMGAVYKARQPNLDRVVALKIVQAPTGEDDPVFAERFAREARAMARLDHPNIVTIYESGEAGGLPYMLMEYVDGITLRDAMENKVLATGEALAIIPQICDALEYAHRTGVVHRDIKPENILIDQTGRVKIADFGLAKLADPTNVTLTRTRQAMGTPHYMAPEQWEKPNEVDHRADIYALGVVLYELLTGELPLGRFDLPSAKGRGSPRLDQVVLRALAKEPGQRYQHASDLKNELSGLGGWWDGPAPRRGFYEFRSKRTLLGWPLVHVVRGRDPATGRLKVAKGWIAVGDGVAVGGVAVGGAMAIGGVSVGGALSIGLLAIGGALGAGLFALGGVTMGLAVAVGGVAISAGLAIGGVAVGTFAIGGATLGKHTLGGSGGTPGFGNALGDAIRGLIGLS